VVAARPERESLSPGGDRDWRDHDAPDRREALNARWIAFSFTALASASFVYLSLFSQRPGFRVVLTNRFMVYTGTISYGLYLLHKIPFDMAHAFRLERYPFLALPLLLAAGYALAALSWNLLEKPFLRLKRFFESKPGRLG